MNNFETLNYTQALAYLDNYNRSRMTPGLERIEKLLEHLGNPHLGQKYIHVAGTNGKGSTCKYIECILDQAGYSVGVFTSPFLVRINENVRLKGIDICDEDFGICMSHIKAALDGDEVLKSQVSRFEIMTALGLYYFKGRCDIVVLEVGMGGLYDSTNVIKDPLLSVITKISYDHTDFLGNTIEAIALEKAGIIKPNCPVVVAPQQYKEVLKIFRQAAKDKNSDITPVHNFNESDPRDLLKELLEHKKFLHTNEIVLNDDGTFDYSDIASIRTNLNGRHQIDNSATAVQAALTLSKTLKISPQNITDGIASAFWPCRIEQVSTEPTIYIDGAHNMDGLTSLVDFLKDKYGDKNSNNFLSNSRINNSTNQYIEFEQKFKFVFGVLQGKGYLEMIDMIAPYADCAYTVLPDSPKAMNPGTLAETFISKGIKATPYLDLSTGIKTMIAESKPSDIIVVFGSLYMVGYAKEVIKKELDI